MTPVRFNPRLPALFREFDELFRDVPTLFAEPASRNSDNALLPPTDILQTDKGMELHMDLPGVKPEEIEVKLDGRVLTISVERRSERSETDKGWLRQERSFGRYVRSFTLPDTIDGAKPEASFKHGVLQVKLPRKPEVQPQKLTVKVEG